MARPPRPSHRGPGAARLSSDQRRTRTHARPGPPPRPAGRGRGPAAPALAGSRATGTRPSRSTATRAPSWPPSWTHQASRSSAAARPPTGPGGASSRAISFSWDVPAPPLGYLQQGGSIVATGEAGPRAGLCQGGGDLVLLGPCGRALAASGRPADGSSCDVEQAGPHLGHGCRGGRLVPLSPRHGSILGHVDPEDRRLMEEALTLVRRFASPGMRAVRP